MLVFDKHSARCVVPPTEDCEVPVTPAVIEDQPQVQTERGQVVISILICRLNSITFSSKTSREMIFKTVRLLLNLSSSNKRILGAPETNNE